jgi:hypothetical protein
MVSPQYSKFRQWTRQLLTAFRGSKPEVVLPTHYVVWSQADEETGAGCIYSSQHMSRSQAQQVAAIKTDEGFRRVRIMRAL